MKIKTKLLIISVLQCVLLTFLIIFAFNITAGFQDVISKDLDSRNFINKISNLSLEIKDYFNGRITYDQLMGTYTKLTQDKTIDTSFNDIMKSYKGIMDTVKICDDLNKENQTYIQKIMQLAELSIKQSNTYISQTVSNLVNKPGQVSNIEKQVIAGANNNTSANYKIQVYTNQLLRDISIKDQLLKYLDISIENTKKDEASLANTQFESMAKQADLCNTQIKQLVIQYVDNYEKSGQNQKIIFDQIEKSSTDVTNQVEAFSNNVFAGFKGRLYLMIFCLLIIAVSTIVLNYIISKDVNYIIGSSLKLAESYSSGDFSVKLERKNSKKKDGNGKNDDEIAILANSFNATTESIKEMMARVKSAVEIVAASSEEMSATTQQIASSSQNQSAGAQQTLSSMEELDASIQSISKNVQEVTGNISVVTGLIKNVENLIVRILTSTSQVNSQAQNTIKATESGKEAIEKSKEGMNRIDQSVGKLVTVIRGLGESAVNIGEIITVIDDISEQTNLLALNAAIEAARAGEHGRGFAVVASAIRDLAEKSGEATKEITKLIRGIQEEVSGAVVTAKEGESEVEQGVELAKETEKALIVIKEAVDTTAGEIGNVSSLTEEQKKAIEDIVESSENINELAQTMAATIQEQTAASSEVVKAVENISQSASNIAQGTGDIASSTESLSKEAQKLSGLISRFKV